MKIDRYFESAFSTSFFAKNINYELFHIVRSYLIKLYFKLIESSQIQLVDLFSYFSPGIFTYPNVIGFDTLDNVLLSENALLSIIKYKNEKYLVSTAVNEDRRFKIYYLIISGDVTTNFRPQELADIILKEAVYHSGYLGKIIRLIKDGYREEVLFKILSIPEVSLDEIYLKDKDKQELIDFVEAVKNRKEGLRYLLVGDPGTGKTETIKAIISTCTKVNNKLTVIVVDAGCKIGLETLFEYAEIFEPVLVCIDDIDLLVGSREARLHASNLSTALQALDGFITRKQTFLIATTNDRTLVDNALKRPGRFDLIIEFSHLEPEFYPALVLRETKDEKFAEIFKDEQIVKKLSSLKVTGAFMVTLVKYLNRERFKQDKYDKNTVIQVIDKLYQSFKKDIKTKENIGFKEE